MVTLARTMSGDECPYDRALALGLLESAADAIVVVRDDGTIVLANHMAERLFGCDRAELVGRPIEVLVPESVAGKHASLRHRFTRASRPRLMGELAPVDARRLDGTLVPVEISLSPVTTAIGKLTIAIVRDVTRRRELEDQLRFASTHDALTGLYNRAHLDEASSVVPTGAGPPWRRLTVRVSWSMTALLMMGNFALIPLLAPYMVNNLHYPKEDLKILYLVGGVVGFTAMRFVGRLVDRAGELAIGAIGTAIFVSTVAVGFFFTLPAPPMALYIGLVLSMAFRAVPIGTLTSKVPRPWERGGFMSGQSAMSHIGSATGTIVASRLVTAASETAPLVGIERVSVLTMTLALLAPVFLWALTKRLRSGAD